MSPSDQPTSPEPSADFPTMQQATQLAQAALSSQDASSTPPDAPAAKRADPKLQESYTWNFDWTDSRGRRWQGRFVNQVRSIYQRRIIGMTSARALGGVPLTSVDPDTAALIQMVAWMQVSLTEKPVWFAEPDKLLDQRLIAEVFQEVASHEATFHGLDKPEASGQAPRRD